MKAIGFLVMGLAIGLLLGSVVSFLTLVPSTQTVTITHTLTVTQESTLTVTQLVTVSYTLTTQQRSTETSVTEKPQPPSFPYIYEKPDNWNGKCIIFVHGMGRDKSVWRRDMDEFKKHGYCVFAFDLPHHGERGKYAPRYFYDVVKTGSQEILEIEDFLRADGADEVYLIGRSLGSITAGVALGDSGIEKAVLLLAAANLTYALSHIQPKTDEERMTIEELLSSPEKLMDIDPLYHLPDYRGRIHFHCGEKDPLLPPPTCQMAYDSAASASERKLIWHDLGHRMPLNEYLEDALTFFEAGSKTLSKLLEMVEIPSTCGNGVCDLGEDWRTCPYDCIGKRPFV